MQRGTRKLLPMYLDFLTEMCKDSTAVLGNHTVRRPSPFPQSPELLRSLRSVPSDARLEAVEEVANLGIYDAGDQASAAVTINAAEASAVFAATSSSETQANENRTLRLHRQRIQTMAAKLLSVAGELGTPVCFVMQFGMEIGPETDESVSARLSFITRQDSDTIERLKYRKHIKVKFDDVSGVRQEADLRDLVQPLCFQE